MFPGRGDDDSINKRYFSESIRTVNIGAFPLTPNKDSDKEGLQLKKHLEEILMYKEIPMKHLDNAIPQRGLVYKEDKQESPVLLIGYSKKENVEIIGNKCFYYIRAMKEGCGIDIPIGFDKAEYLLLHTNRPEERKLYKIKGKPRFATGKEIKDMGFVSFGLDTDMYIGYSLDFEIDDNVLLDLYSVRIPNDERYFVPAFRTLDKPDVF